MTQDEFRKGVAKLERHTGRTLKTEQANSWWENVQGLPGPAFVEACHQIARRKNTFPTIDEITDQMSELNLRARENRKVPCSRCDGTGFIPFFRERGQTGSIVSGRCSCENGQRKSDLLARYDDLFPGQSSKTFDEYCSAALDPERDWINSVRQKGGEHHGHRRI